jgi:hypothetical protein
VKVGIKLYDLHTTEDEMGRHIVYIGRRGLHIGFDGKSVRKEETSRKTQT